MTNIVQDNPADPGDPRHRASTLSAYALPAIPLAALTLPLYVLIPTFYTETIGLSLGSVAFALVVIRIFDAINDPIIGYFADRARFRIGRRRGVFLLSLPLSALGTFMVFWPPEQANSSYLLIWGLVMSLGYTASIIPLAAWGAELAGSYRERTRLAAYREGFTLIGTLLAISIPFAIGIDRAEGVHGLAGLAILIAISLPVCGIYAVWRVPEPVDHSVTKIPLRQSLKFLPSNKPFLRLVSAFFLNGFANGIPATLFLYFVSERLGLPEQRGPLLFLYFFAAVAGVPLATRAATIWGKHRSWCYAMILACLVFAMTPFLDEGSILAFSGICVITGLLLGFDLTLPSAIQADVIDVDTANTGEQRSGLYFASWSLTTKLSLAAGVGLVFPLLGAFGFDPQADGNNSDDALIALAVIYAWLPILLKFVAIGLMWNFPLGDSQQAELRSEIEGRAAT